MNTIIYLIEFVSSILTLYMWVVIIAALITWVSPDPRNPIVRFLRTVTEPILYWIRRHIPTNFGGFDIAPFLVVLAIMFIQSVLLRSLLDWLIGAPRVF